MKKKEKTLHNQKKIIVPSKPHEALLKSKKKPFMKFNAQLRLKKYRNKNKNIVTFLYLLKGKLIRIVLRTRFGFKKRHIRIKKRGRKFRFLRKFLRRRTIKKITYTLKVLQQQFFYYLKLGRNKQLFRRLCKVFNQWFWSNYSRYLNFEYYLYFRIFNFVKRLKFLKRINFKNLKILISQGMVQINNIKIFTLLIQVFFFDFVEFAYSRLFEYLGLFFYRRKKFWFRGLRRYRKPYWLRKKHLKKSVSSFTQRQYQRLMIHKMKYRRKTQGYKRYILRRRKHYKIRKRRSLYVRIVRRRRRYKNKHFTWRLFPWGMKKKKRRIINHHVAPPKLRPPFSTFFLKYYRRVFRKAYSRSKRKKRRLPHKNILRYKYKNTWRIFSKKSFSVIPLLLKIGKRGKLPFKKTQKRFARTIVQFLYFHIISTYK